MNKTEICDVTTPIWQLTLKTDRHLDGISIGHEN
jgi:hypothetical protein